MDEKKTSGEDTTEDNLGCVLWKLEAIENFFSCYKSMIEQK